MTSEPKDSTLVLGLVSRMAPASFEPFVLSLRRSGFAGQVGLVAAGYDEADVATIRGMVDHLWLVDDQYLPSLRFTSAVLRRWATTRVVWRFYPLAFLIACSLKGERLAMNRWRRLQFELQSLISLRCAHFYDAVHSLPDVTAVLVTDVRDVLFQDDPFRQPVTGLELFTEEAGVTIGKQVANRDWILDLYGPSVLAQLEAKPVSCCGTVIGDRASVLHYLAEMRQESFWRRKPLTAHDQGIHNYLLWTGRLAPMRLVANGEGRVLTMALMATIDRNEQGFVINRDGSVPAVIHQYDRHPEAQALQELLAGANL